MNGERDAAISPIQTKDRDRGSPNNCIAGPGPKVRCKFHPELGEFAFKIRGHLRNEVLVLSPLLRHTGRDCIAMRGVLGSLRFSLSRAAFASARFRAISRLKRRSRFSGIGNTQENAMPLVAINLR